MLQLMNRSNEPYDPYIPSGSNAGVGPSGQPQGQSNQKVRQAISYRAIADHISSSFSINHATLLSHFLLRVVNFQTIDLKHSSPD